ncbi:hypothetical protein [Ulvibacterium sp.]|uniref:hypothetical protein n=1 Tax=Ulvibacterium sp. TaxID=2665914 RepID=UPI003BAA2880
MAQLSYVLLIPMQNNQGTFRYLGLKRILLATFVFMMVGTVLELYLLDHYEGAQQLIPILCIGASILTLFILFFRRTNLTMGLFKLILVVTALSGVYGAFLHLRANYEFEQEMKPTVNGWDLFVESLSGALPALAPFSMIVLALIGYSYLILIKQRK